MMVEKNFFVNTILTTIQFLQFKSNFDNSSFNAKYLSQVYAIEISLWLENFKDASWNMELEIKYNTYVDYGL